ncbi:MAG TPA: extracellular solute-binding protein [Pyrinomonadaceae bacterium]
MRGKLYLTILVVCVSALLFSCNRGSAPAKRKLLIYTPHGQDLLKESIARFQAVHTDVDVQFLDMGSREVLERIRAERNRPQADLWWGAAHTTFQTAADENLLAPYRPTWADAVRSDVRDSHDRWYGTFKTPEVIVYNSDAIKPEEAPKDWDDVLDPKWRDKILIRNPNPSDSMRAIYGAMIWRFHKDTGSPAAGYEWLKRLDANVKEYTADGTLMMQKLVRQEGLITLWNLPDVWIYKEQRGFPVSYVFPTSGTPVITDGIAIVRGAPNEEDAKRFYEFVNTPESLTLAAKKYYRMPVRNDLDRTQLPAWMNEPVNEMQIDWNVLRSQINEWMRHWDTEIRGKGN